LLLERPSRTRAGVLALAVLLLPILLFGERSDGATPGCGSFASQADAQDRFAELGGSPGSPIPRLDPDRDGVACAGLPGPYKGYATVAYNRKRSFFFGTVSMPPVEGGGFACLEGNPHFTDGPRLLTLFRVRPGPDLAIRAKIGTQAQAGSGRLLWKVEKEAIAPGDYYVVFEERQPLSPYGPNECPGFRSAEVRLPKPVS
jgi:hypothetical protein